MKKVLQYFIGLQRFLHTWWYGPVFFLICFLDHYVIVVPVLGMLVSSILLAPQKWLKLSIWGAVGSALGATSIGWVAHEFGLSLIHNYYPSVMQSGVWTWAESFFTRHGIWVIFVSGVSPIAQQPAVIVSAIAGAPILEIGGILLVGKLIKFIFIGALASYAPQYLTSFRSVRQEVEELHIETSPTKRNP